MIKSINYNRELLENKIKLKKEFDEKIKKIDDEIMTQKENCNHISVCLGWAGVFPYLEMKHQCLICRTDEPSTKYEVIKADFNPKDKYYDSQSEKSRNERLNEIQELAINLMSQDPFLTEEELIANLNKIIQKNIEQPQKKLNCDFI